MLALRPDTVGTDPASTSTSWTADVGLSGQPTVEIDREGSEVTYTVDHAQWRNDDVVRIKLAGSLVDLDAAHPMTPPSGERSQMESVVEGQSRCVTAQVVRGEEASPWSTPICSG